MYLREYFNPTWKKQVEEMVSYVKKVAKLFLQKSFNSNSKIIKKLDAMKDFIAYPEEMLSKSAIDEYYRDLSISKDSLSENIKSIARFFINKSFARLGKRWNSDAWDLESHQVVNTVNAYYEILLNELVVAAGFLQEFNYAYDHPMYLNFAITGHTIGHEILHGFDNYGMLFDENGKHLDQPLLNETSGSNIVNQYKWNQYSECLVQEYNKLNVTQLTCGHKHHINGEQTLRENFADVGGVKLAYYAFKLWTNTFGEDNLLPGLNFTSNQLFWIRSAQLHCSKFGDDALEDFLANDHYTPGGFRANGFLSFSEEFAKDFSCSKGTQMNPTRNCTVENLWPTIPLSELEPSKQSDKNSYSWSASGTKSNMDKRTFVELLSFTTAIYSILPNRL
jgi:predicted metalloendopeptidase